MNILDLEDVRMRAEKRCAERYRAVKEKFFQPEIQTDYGEIWHKVNRNPAAREYMRQAIPDQVKQMEARYGSHQSAGK